MLFENLFKVATNIFVNAKSIKGNFFLHECLPFFSFYKKLWRGESRIKIKKEEKRQQKTLDIAIREEMFWHSSDIILSDFSSVISHPWLGEYKMRTFWLVTTCTLDLLKSFNMVPKNDKNYMILQTPLYENNWMVISS